MLKTIELAAKNIEYTLKVSNASRHLRLAVYPGGSVTVTAPRFLSLPAIERFIIDKSDWVLKKISQMSSVQKPLKVKSSKLDYIRYKAVAKKIARDKMLYFNQFYNYNWNKISIKNQSTRWGSCSKQGNINFNYKIALLPEQMVDYIIVHELSHLGQFNHSDKFWSLVARTIPDHKKIRRALKKYSLKTG
ncbi:MAG: M48 family metallopeptidase [Candidatus Magasanikbacteria bacterium]|nr:M48 family metallopeptidase [Candidatus Magasanikbacteria bacterium]